MGYLGIIDISLPLKNPVLLFSLILFIILFAPILLNKLKIPHLIGLIIAGAIIGPNGFNLMLRDSSIILYGTVGLLYIMFLAGLEIDMGDFRKNSGKSVFFGLLVFITSMGIGFAGAYYILRYDQLTHFPLETSVLLASIFASHTLIAYPLISKLGVAKNRAVNVAIGGTLLTDTLALLVLAVIVGLTSPKYGGDIPNEFWWRLSISVVLFGALVLIVFPIIGRWFFKRYDDNISQYIFVLALVFLGAFLAELAGIEHIIGAFLAGLALNRLIPHTSPLMNRIEFVGNALFIPFFLIGVGMLIDFTAFFKDLETIKVAVMMTVIALAARYISAWITQKTFGYTADERRLIFGLTSAQAAATLAVVLVGHNIILNQPEIDAAIAAGAIVEPVRLLGDSVLNGSILMILVTCTIASLVAQRGAQSIALQETSGAGASSDDHQPLEKILVPLNNHDTAEEMIRLALIIKSKKNKSGLYALNVIDNTTNDAAADKQAHRILNRAAKTAAAADVHVHELLRYDLNIVNGIASTVREHRISDMILGLHEEKGISDNFLGNLTEGILTRCNTTTMIYKPSQPLATIKRHLVVVPERAEKEIGFPLWLFKVWNIAQNTGARLVFYAPEQTLRYIRDVNARHPVPCDFIVFSDWNDFLILSRDVRSDDNLVLVLSRRERPSYHSHMTRIPVYLNKYFQSTNFILIYPVQSGVAESYNVDLKNPSVLEPLEKLDDLGKTIAGLFKRK